MGFKTKLLKFSFIVFTVIIAANVLIALSRNLNVLLFFFIIPIIVFFSIISIVDIVKYHHNFGKYTRTHKDMPSDIFVSERVFLSYDPITLIALPLFEDLIYVIFNSNEDSHTILDKIYGDDGYDTLNQLLSSLTDGEINLEKFISIIKKESDIIF
ncbi:MAG: hypothetical protein ACTSQY_07730 [Candidatus Odinarchaeia archaeon]